MQVVASVLNSTPMTPTPFKRSAKTGSSYYVAFMVAGRAYQFSTKTDDLVLAKKRGKAYRDALVAKNYGLAKSMKRGGDAVTIGDLIAAYMALPAPSEGTRKRNVAALRAIMAVSRLTDADRLARLDAEVINRYQKHCLVERPGDVHAEISCNSVVRKARSLFARDALSRYRGTPNEVPEDLVTGLFSVRPLKVPTMPIILPSDEAQAAAWQTLTGPARRCYILARFAGLRASEIKEARRSWIVGNVLTVGPNPAEFVPKSGKARKIVLPQQAIDELLLGDDPVYLVGPNRKQLVNHEMPTALQKLGFPKNPLHSLRRLFGSIIYTTQGGWQAKTALGHSSLAVTESHYARPLHLPAAVEWVS